jgi:very-short-patch-repair endonuclease
VAGAANNINVNADEALATASLVVAATEQPEYAQATFGVISLVGERQALEIDRLLRRHVPAVEYERRRIMCGNAAQFQDDERDVMFLSMVDSPRSGPLALRTLPLFKKRFNVAASRARDQMWVVTSLDASVDLKPGDLRRRLLEHAIDPDSLMRRVADVERHVESEFERQVARRLVGAGYHVDAQWQVGYYRIDLVVSGSGGRLAIECDGDRFHPLEKVPEDMERQAILERLGWRFVRIRGSEFFRNQDEAMRPVFERLETLGINRKPVAIDETHLGGHELRDRVIRRAEELRRDWDLAHQDLLDGNSESKRDWPPKSESSPPNISESALAYSIPIEAVSDDSSLPSLRLEPWYLRDSQRELESDRSDQLDASRLQVKVPAARATLADELRALGHEVEDLWPAGRLYVVGGSELTPLIDMLRDRGIVFRPPTRIFALGNRLGWGTDYIG